MALVGATKEPMRGAVGVVDVRDVARAHVIAVESEGVAGKRLFCCAAVRAWRAIPDEIRRQFPGEFPDLPEVPEGFPPAEAFDGHYVVDTSELAGKGMGEYVPFEVMIRDTVEFMRDGGFLAEK
jgi:nucleoside-diphosphate-sugar epimerase